MESKNDTVNELMDEGRKLVTKANRRHVIIRNADGTTLFDLTATVVAIIVVAMIVIQPLGTFAAIGAIGYGLYRKVKIEVIHEVTSDEDVINVKMPQE